MFEQLFQNLAIIQTRLTFKSRNLPFYYKTVVLNFEGESIGFSQKLNIMKPLFSVPSEIFCMKPVFGAIQFSILDHGTVKRFQNGSFSVPPSPGVIENSFSVFSCPPIDFSCPPLSYRYFDKLYKMWQIVISIVIHCTKCGR